MESDSHLTEKEQEVYEILKKKQDFLAKAVKERSDYWKKKPVKTLYLST